jgi:hypothetical protein
MAEKKSRVLCVDGFVIKKDFILVSTEPEESLDYEFARVSTMKEGKWGYVDIDEKVYSVCAVDGSPREYYCLGRDGTVHILRSGGKRTEQIPDAGTWESHLGYVVKIREIGGKLYVCGASSQIYKREPQGWVHFDEGVLDRSSDPAKAIALWDLDGTSEANVYAVGEQGSVWHNNGSKWEKLAVPTTDVLTAVRCLSNTQTYIVGHEGLLLKGSGKSWADLSNRKIKNHFWDVEVYKGITYLAALEGLFAFNGEEIVPVDTGITPKPDAYRLHANDGVLWSFGAERLCFFDGKTWTYVKHPDNPE